MRVEEAHSPATWSELVGIPNIETAVSWSYAWPEGVFWLVKCSAGKFFVIYQKIVALVFVGVVILSSTSLLRVVGRYVTVAGTARPSHYACVFEIWYFVGPESNLRLYAYFTRTYFRETAVCHRLNEGVSNDRIAFMCSGKESQDP
jgi:hypothetical protein